MCSDRIVLFTQSVAKLGEIIRIPYGCYLLFSFSSRLIARSFIRRHKATCKLQCEVTHTAKTTIHSFQLLIVMLLVIPSSETVC